MAQQRMHSGDGFDGVKGGCPWRHSVRSQRSLRRLRNGFLCQRMRQRLKCHIVFQRQMRSFIRFNKREDWRGVVNSDFARRNSQCSLAQREPMRIRESRSVAMPCAERRQVIAFSSHLGMEPDEKCRCKLRRKSVVVCQHGSIALPGEELVIRFAAHRHLLSFLDDGFDFL
jgi:hypothetical protein